jgi:tRNA pseudouridine55 synthase
LQEAFQAGNWYQFLIPAAEALADWPAIELNPDDVEEVRHGHRVKAQGEQSQLVRGVSMAGELIALMVPATGEDGSAEWQPKKVFFTSEAKGEND